MTLIFYTVLLNKDGFPVKCLDAQTHQRKTLSGPFSDPGEASQEFKVRIGQAQTCYLEPKQFQAKAKALAKLRRERAKKGEPMPG